jgi:hypothetical protein
MKIRKLILKAKLEQIKKQSQNIFIFHCSANAAQWRLFKNLLFIFCANASESQKFYSIKKEYTSIYDQGSKDAQLLQSEQCLTGATFSRYFVWDSKLTGLKKKIPADLPKATEASNSFSFGPQSIDQRTLSIRGFTFFQSTNNKKKQSVYRKQSNKLSKTLVAPCLFFFEFYSPNILDKQQKNSLCLELMNKIESLESNNVLHLLYGQINSTILNHVDIKFFQTLASQKGIQTTYQNLFLSMERSSELLHNLYYYINEFLYIQELRSKKELISAQLEPNGENDPNLNNKKY